MRIALVGSGMSAIAALDALNQFDQIKLINFRLDDEEDLTRASDSYFKKKDGKGTAYDIGKYSSFVSLPFVSKTMAGSKGINGFSDVWGASLDEDDEGYISNKGEFFFENIEANINLDRTIFIDSESVQVKTESSRLARSQKLCKNVGSCLIGCPNNAIWKSSNYYGNPVSKSGIEIINDGVLTFQILNKYIEITTFSGQKYKVDSLILAAGTLGTLAILNRSYGELYQFTIEDSATQFFLALKLRPFKLKNLSTLHQWRISIKNQSFESQMQIYNRISNLKETAKFGKNRLVKIFIDLLWPIVSHFFIAGISYIDGKNSNSLQLNFSKGVGELRSLPNINQIRVRRLIWKTIFRNSFELGFLPLKFTFQDNGSGSGFHFGKTMWKSESGLIPLNDAISEITSSNAVLVVDSNAVPHVPAGPITSLIGRNAKELTVAFVKSRL